jgi:outer membrane protein OmpA-like peptidoglycan-associated protein
MILLCLLLTSVITNVKAIPSRYAFERAKGGHKYHVRVSKPNRSMSVAEITKNVEFEFASAGLQPGYDDQLDQLAKLMTGSKKTLLLRGHADAIGNYIKNWKLSDKRAIAVKEYLVAKGVAADRIVTSPFGSTIPIASNKTAAGRKKNRRIEIRM